jgi:hypothetical protein
MMRPLAGGLIGLAFGLLCLWATVSTLRSGKVYGGRGRSGKAYTREEWPVTFWFHVLVYTIVTVAIFALAVRRLLPA